MKSQTQKYRINLVNEFYKRKKVIKPRLQKFFYTIIIAISALPFLSRDISEIKKGISEKFPTLDIYYYQRIFSKNTNPLNLGDFYVDLNEFSYRATTVLSVGETLQKLAFNLSQNNILLTYYLLTLVYLIIWIVLITKLISSGRNYYMSSLIVIFFILLFLGNSRIFNNQYPFARLISPQFAVMLWLLGLVMIKTIISKQTSVKKSYIYVFFYSIILMVSSFSYLYSFLSLLGSGLVLLGILFYEKKYKLTVSLLILVVIFSSPFFAVNYIKSKEIRFLEASERMGMIQWRLPGSITSIIICSIIIIFILFQSYSNENRLKLSESKRIVLVMSIGILLASQSQIVTNFEIQFYHFGVFSQICFMLLLILYFNDFVTNKFNFVFNKLHFQISTAIILVLAIFSIDNRIIPLMKNYQYGFAENFYSDNLNGANNVIIDEATLQYIFPVYSRAKVLYQADIVAYGYSNFEVLDRAYTSSGCPNDISNDLKSEWVAYRLEGIKQRYNTIDRYLNLFSVPNLFLNYREELIISLRDKEYEINSQISRYLLNEAGKDCLQKAKSFGVDTIIFDKRSNWNLVLKKHQIKIESFGLHGLLKAHI